MYSDTDFTFNTEQTNNQKQRYKSTHNKSPFYTTLAKRMALFTMIMCIIVPYKSAKSPNMYM